MALGDLNTDAGIKELNLFLEDKSYICGYLPTQMDVTAFKTITKPPKGTYAHALRWYNHIKSFSADECEKFIAGVCPAKAGRECIMKVGDACPMKTAPTTTQAAKDDDDDVDLFASDEEESEEAARIRDERVKAYADKKSQKPGLIAKSSILLDVKPWDDETNMKVMEEKVRKIEMDGLVWGVSKLVPVGYGIHKLQIVCVVVDDKVSVDLLTEEIEKIEDYVQSVDIAAFNKI